MSRYSNFKDPVGLIRRIALDRNPAALEALGRTVAGVPASLLDRVLEAEEKRLMSEARPSPFPVVLIVGAPRSGTTLAHQLLSAHCAVSYFTNRNSLFSRAPLSASRRFDHFPAEAGVSESFYGLSAGLNSPNDAFHIWNRWGGEDRYTPVPLNDASRANMRQFFDAWRTVHPMPLVSKNNRNTAQMPALQDAIDGVRLVVVHRDPVYVAQSLLEARVMVQGSMQEGWGLGQLSTGDPVDDVIRQVREVAAMVERDAPAGAIHIEYEDLCADPAWMVKTVASEASLRVRALDRLSQLENTNVDRLEPTVMRRLRNELS